MYALAVHTRRGGAGLMRNANRNDAWEKRARDGPSLRRTPCRRVPSRTPFAERTRWSPRGVRHARPRPRGGRRAFRIRARRARSLDEPSTRRETYSLCDRYDWLFAELVAANITERLLSQYYTQKETGFELRQSGDATHTRKEVTTGNWLHTIYTRLLHVVTNARHDDAQSNVSIFYYDMNTRAVSCENIGLRRHCDVVLHNRLSDEKFVSV